MKRMIHRLSGMCAAAWLLLPSLAMAAGDKATNIVVVADTRRGEGIMRYFSDLYNTNIWLFAVWTVLLTVVMGCTLGFMMDFIMERTGLDLKSRKIVEH